MGPLTGAVMKANVQGRAIEIGCYGSIFGDAATVDALLYRIAEEILTRNDQLATCVEFTSAEFTATFDGEQGPLQQIGGWAEARWWRGTR